MAEAKQTIATAKVVETWYINHYTCPKCDSNWEDEWDCMVDEQCPQCGTRNISPYHSESVKGD